MTTTKKARRPRPEHPVQPLVWDKHKVLRFKQNKIVRFLLEAGPFDMNKLACMEFSQEDREQFAQLIGYSLSGFGDLSYVRDKTYKKAEAGLARESVASEEKEE